jgi:hypothetical protein
MIREEGPEIRPRLRPFTHVGREEEILLRAEQDREFREAVELDQRAQEQKQRVSRFFRSLLN